MAWQITSANGIHLPQVGLHCDAPKRVHKGFVSHAHFDHLGSHRCTICSEGTSRLMKLRVRGEREEVVLPFGARHVLDLVTGAELVLHPAGHVLGSSQLWVTYEGESLLYTGDFKLRPGRSCEPCATPRSEVLVMETTFGVPRYVMPPAEAVAESICAFCRESIAAGAVPVLLAYSLGKSQELLAWLLGLDSPVMLQERSLEVTRVYESLGVAFPPYTAFDAAQAAGHVVIGPPPMRGLGWLESIPKRRTAMVTGWALDASARYRFRCDAAFALTDHADFPDLLRFVEAVQPKRVYTVHGFAREFAATLRARGIEAWALGLENQLELGI